jgi:hypothetical protein
MRRTFALAAVTSVLVVLAATPAAQAAGTSCATFTVKPSYGTFTFHITAKRVSCATVRRVVRAYFFGPAHKTGPSASDPTRVYGWDVFIIDRTAQGTRGRRSFSGSYD